MVGDIYLGRIARVLPGIRAAFIDIGMKHDAFLHFQILVSVHNNLQDMLGDEDTDVDWREEVNESVSTQTKNWTEEKLTANSNPEKGTGNSYPDY